MRADDLILVSIDDHVVEPADLFTRHIPAMFRDGAPRVARKKNGADVWVFEGQQLPNIGLNAVAGRPPEEYGIEPTAFEQLRTGCYDVRARVRDMSANGVLASLCFPSFTGLAGQMFLKAKDKELSLACLKAYNDWHIDEWCGAAPDRFIPLALVPLWDPALAAEEVRRVAKKGCLAVTMSDQPGKIGLPTYHSDHWDPVWKACEETGTIVCLHIGSSEGMYFTSLDAPIDVMITLIPLNVVNCASDLIWSPMLRKFPTLKLALSEGGIGWVPYFMERIDYVYEHHRLWTNQRFGAKRPSELFAERIVTCFISDRTGLRDLGSMNADNVTWECDYPHSDTTWPRSPELLFDELKHLPDETIAKVTYQNALRHFRFDPFRHRPIEKATVAALRAEAADVDVAPRSRSGGSRVDAQNLEPVTCAHVVKQLTTAMTSPLE